MAAAATKPVRRRWLYFVVVGVVMAASVVGAIGLFAYDKATEPDRSTPSVAMLEFLQAAI